MRVEQGTAEPHTPSPPAQSWEQSTPLDKKQLAAGAVSAGTCWLRQRIGGGWEREGCKQGVEAEEGQGVWRQDQDTGKEQEVEVRCENEEAQRAISAFLPVPGFAWPPWCCSANTSS